MKRLFISLALAMFGCFCAPLAQAMPSEVTVTSQSGELSDGDREFLVTETNRLELPEQVQRVHYVVLSHNGSKFNDSMVNFAKEKHPDWLSADQQKWAPGVLVVAVGLDPRRNGMYCGEDVCAALNLNSNGHLSDSLDAGKDSFRDGRYAAGLFAMTKASLAEHKETPMWGVFTGIGGAITAGLALLFAGLRINRVNKARKQFAFVTEHYADVAQRFDEINVMAHNLNSPLADDTLRRDFAEVRDEFLSIHELQQRIPDLTGAPRKVFAKYASDIAKMHAATEKMKNAMDNIETLSRMERGDASVRRAELSELRIDLREAALKSTKYQSEGNRLVAFAEGMDVESEDFMDHYARLLDDTSLFFKLVAEEQNLKGQDAGETPHVYDSDWRPGYGYHNFVAFSTMNSWHSSAVATESSSVDTSYSGGFSGGGGSSSW
ncbi:DUF5129 domain-containing protein [Staphylococcus chromogenes]|nr:DUF5129 domain-containing protein [Staphylococcus chromogenes]